MVSQTRGLDMDKNLIFIPQSVEEKKYYSGAFEKPPQWKRLRFLYIERDQMITCMIEGDLLAPQDIEAFQLFDSYYNSGSSTISYKDNKLVLVTEGSHLPRSIDKDDIHSLLVDCYKAINFRRCDYSDELYDIYFKNSFTITKRKGVDDNFDDKKFRDREFAPDVYVRPLYSPGH